MMKSNKLRLLSASLLMTGTLALASCGNSKGFTGAVDPTVDTRGTTLEFWTGFGTTISSYLTDNVLSNLEEKYEIKVTHTSKGGYDNLQKAINLGASSISYPNIAVGYPDHFASYIDSDIQLRLDSFIESDANIPETRDDGFKEAAKIDMDDFYSYYLEENQTLEYDENGKGYTLGLPFNKSTELMIYNKTFFENDWVKSQGISLPETWDDLATQGAKIKALAKKAMGQVLGADGNLYETSNKATEAKTTVLLDLTNATEATFIPFTYDSAANLFIGGLKQWGGVYTELDKDTRRGYIAFDKGDNYTIALNFLNYMSKLAADGIIGVPTSFGGTDLYASSYYVIYQSVMNVGSSAGLSNYSTSGKFESGITHIPYKDADHKYVISQGTNLCMFDKGSEAEREASWKAIKYLATEGNAQFAVLTGYYPVTKAATNSTLYQEFITGADGDDSENTRNLRNGAKYNASGYDASGSGWTKFVDPGFNGSSTIRTQATNLMTEVVINHPENAKSILDSYISQLSSYVRS